MKILIENYLQHLYQDDRANAKEFRGPNHPVETDNKEDLISQCLSFPCDRKKINCLRKLRDQVAMNPFYQYRIDRFVDAITQTYEPTDKPGTIPGNEFEMSKLHESENVNEFIGAALNAMFWISTVSDIMKGSKSLYKNVLSKAARDCSGANNKEKCMNLHRIQAVKQQIAFIKEKGKQKCPMTKNYKACLNKIDEKVNNLNQKIIKMKQAYIKQQKIGKYQQKIRDLEG